MSRRIGRPKEKQADGNQSVEQSEHIQHLSIKFTVLYGHGFVVPQNNYNGNIKDHRSQITITNIIIMKKFGNIVRITKM